MSDGIEFNATKFDVKPDFEDAVHSNTSVTVIPDIPDIPDIPVNPVNPDKTAPSNLDGNEQIIFKSRRNVVIPKSIALDSNKQTPRPAINGKPRFKLKNKTNTQKNIYSDLTGKGPNL